jgi:hypothetical protein
MWDAPFRQQLLDGLVELGCAVEAAFDGTPQVRRVMAWSTTRVWRATGHVVHAHTHTHTQDTHQTQTRHSILPSGAVACAARGSPRLTPPGH